jgi:hypothetical protein
MKVNKGKKEAFYEAECRLPENPSDRWRSADVVNFSHPSLRHPVRHSLGEGGSFGEGGLPHYFARAAIPLTFTYFHLVPLNST